MNSVTARYKMSLEKTAIILNRISRNVTRLSLNDGLNFICHSTLAHFPILEIQHSFI